MSKSDQTLIFGIHAVKEALRNGVELDRILVKKPSDSPGIGEITRSARNSGVPLQHVPVEKLDRITSSSHQGVIAYMSLIPYWTIEKALEQISSIEKTPLGLILDGVTDVRNFGAICRTAECFGVDFIVIPEKGSAKINSDAIRTSSGALHTIPICRVGHLLDAIHFLKASNFQVVCADEKSEDSISKTKFDGPLAIVMGSESRGIGRSLLKNSDRLLKIPISGKVSSLNVGVATGVMLYWAAVSRFDA